MQIRTRNVDGTVTVDIIDSTDGAIAGTYEVPAGDQIVVNSPNATSPADIEAGEVEAIPADAPPAGEGGAAPADGEGAGAPAGEEAAGGTPPAEGAETSGEAAGGTPSVVTSEASEKPLYTLSGDVPEGFVPAGLQTPDGAVLYHFDGDTAGAAHTADVGVEGLDLYAEADDNSQPVVVAPVNGTDAAPAA